MRLNAYKRHVGFSTPGIRPPHGINASPGVNGATSGYPGVGSAKALTPGYAPVRGAGTPSSGLIQTLASRRPVDRLGASSFSVLGTEVFLKRVRAN
jgi:hypothetical protein